MCIRVEYAPRHLIREIYDAERQVITIPVALAVTAWGTEQAVRAVLHELHIDQPSGGALCWCGDNIIFPAAIPQQRQNEVTTLRQNKTSAKARHHAS